MPKNPNQAVSQFAIFKGPKAKPAKKPKKKAAITSRRG